MPKDKKPREGAYFDMDDYENIYFPNWFYREDVDGFLGRRLTDAEWALFRQSDEQADIVSRLVREHVTEFFKNHAR